jgi:hypothetical protein
MINIPTGWTKEQLDLFKTKYLSEIKNKIFLLGSTERLKYFKNFRDLFHLLPAYDDYSFTNKSILTELNKKIHCKWSIYLNYFFLYIIKYSENDITGIISLPKNKEIPKIRECTDPKYLYKKNTMKFIGFIIIPIKRYDKKISEKYLKIEEIFIAVFEDNNKFILYSTNLVLIVYGNIFPVHTILYDELKGLFNYLNKYGNEINAFYDKEFPHFLFLSNKEKEYITHKYNMVKINYVENNNQFKFINQNENIIIKSVPESNILYSPQNGGNIYFDKILFSSIKLLISFQNYLLVKYTSIVLINFINKYYNEFKLIEDKNIIATYSYSKNKKHILLASKYITNKIEEQFINEKIYSFGYFDSLQLLYDDSLKFNKNISICEISILPSCFEVLKNFNVDVFYNNSNYLNYSIKSWKELINNYKLYMPNNVNFIYNESKYLIKNNYDILIINLIKNLDFDYNKQNIKNEPNEYTKYSVNTILKYVKKQLKYLNYIKIGGSCYFKIHNLWSNDTVNIYYKIWIILQVIYFYYLRLKLFLL